MSPALLGFIGYLVAVLVISMATFRLTKTVADYLRAARLREAV